MANDLVLLDPSDPAILALLEKATTRQREIMECYFELLQDREVGAHISQRKGKIKRRGLYAEVAGRLGLSASTVRVQMHRMKAKLAV